MEPTAQKTRRGSAADRETHDECRVMSYDLHLVPNVAGRGALEYAREALKRDSDEINPGPVVPEKEAKKKRLATSLVRHNPQLQPFQFGYAEIAAKYGITDDEARVRFRHI